MLGEFLHTCLIAEDRAFGALTGGIDGEDCQTTALLTEHMYAELIDGGGLAGTWYATDTHTDTVAAIGQTLVNDLLSARLVVGVHTLNERDGL